MILRERAKNPPDDRNDIGSIIYVDESPMQPTRKPTENPKTIIIIIITIISIAK